MNVYQNQHDTLVKSTETKYVSNQRRYDTNQQAIIRTSSLDSLCDRVTQDTGRFNLRTYLIPSFKSTAVVQHNSKQSISDRIRLPSFFETITRAADLSIKYQSEKFRKFAESSAGDINSMIQLPNLDIADSFWNSKPTGLNPQNCCIPERIDKMRFNSNCCNYLSDPPLSAPADVLAYYQRGQDHPFFFWDSINSDKTLRNDMADCGINVRQQDCQESSVKVRKQNEDLEYQNNYNSTIINNQESNDLIWTEIDENSCTEFQNRCNKQYAESEVINNYKAQIFVDENTASLPSELYGCNEVISGINSNSEMFTESFSFNELANKLDDKILTEFDKTDTAKHQLYTDKNKASTEKSSQKQNDILLDQKNNQISHKYSCNDCKKLFGSRSALAKHRLVHSKYRKYICHSCSKSFKRQDHL
ncbi:hypothetical protein GJ496_001768 [Pomphorhynchus laevis]|nr:hypothetical protein GJ496_001768 [Pomphorhynchus laevis]